MSRTSCCFFLWTMLFSLVAGIGIRCPPASCGEPSRQVSIGNRSGYLGNPEAQATLKLQPGDTLCINPGTYSGRVPYITEDQHHQDRYEGAAGDIGAVERPKK